MDTRNSASSMPAQPVFMRENVLTCPECPPEDGYEIIDDYSSGDWICTGCGLVLDRVIDDRSEWRTFANEDGSDGPDRSRTGDHAGEELVTFIGGNTKTSSLARAEKRGREANQSSMAIQRANARIDEFCQLHGLSTAVRDLACTMYKMTQEAHIFHGQVKQEAMLGPLIFMACQTLRQPRGFNEICRMTGQSKRSMNLELDRINSFLMKKEPRKTKKAKKAKKLSSASTSAKVEEGPSPLPDVTTDGPRPDTKAGRVKEPVARFVAGMNFKNPFVVETTAMRMAEKAEAINTPFDGRAPSSLAAAYICVASWLVGEPRKVKEVVQGCRIGEGTLKAILKSMVQMQDQLVDPSWKAVDVSLLKDFTTC
ncbi:Transcription initiation factor IIB [Apiospora rasikravindrae]|uniref:General transcription factor TFIIB n=1 Tax=Apiospora rasikravindrae TaxID=990691 RepID=A0ABR1SKL1_9PEZI